MGPITMSFQLYTDPTVHSAFSRTTPGLSHKMMKSSFEMFFFGCSNPNQVYKWVWCEVLTTPCYFFFPPTMMTIDDPAPSWVPSKSLPCPRQRPDKICAHRLSPIDSVPHFFLRSKCAHNRNFKYWPRSNRSRFFKFLPRIIWFWFLLP